MLRVLLILSHYILSTTSSEDMYLHFADEETEAQGGYLFMATQLVNGGARV